MHKLGIAAAVVTAVVLCGLSFAWAAAQTTATNVACATATATLPAHTVGVDGSAVHTIPGTSTTTSRCRTATYTISTVTVTVTASPSSTTSTSTTTATTTTRSGTDCFASPGACGYPDPAAGNVGATSSCSSLTSSGSVTASTSGQTVGNLNITGDLTITAPNVTVSNVCINEPAQGSGVLAVEVGPGAGGLTLNNVTVRAAGLNAFDTGVWNPYEVPVTASRISITDAAESWHGEGTVNDSYMQAGAFFTDSNGPSHNEDVYISDSSWSGTHDTLLNSQSQTAIFFGDNNGGTCCIAANNHWTVKNSLLAGGGFAAYWNAKSDSAGTSTMDIENNRWARCDGPTHFDGSGTTCTTGADQFGYYPNIGYYGGPVDGYCSTGNTWTGNVYDDTNATIPCD